MNSKFQNKQLLKQDDLTTVSQNERNLIRHVEISVIII